MLSHPLAGNSGYLARFWRDVGSATVSWPAPRAYHLLKETSNALPGTAPNHLRLRPASIGLASPRPPHPSRSARPASPRHGPLRLADTPVTTHHPHRLL